MATDEVIEKYKKALEIKRREKRKQTIKNKHLFISSNEFKGDYFRENYNFY